MESFVDVDSDGLFNSVDVPLEIGETFRDDNENGMPDPSVGEVFSDFNSNGPNEQPMAGGTTIQANISNGSIAGPSNYIVQCSNFDGRLDYIFSLEPDSTPGGGLLTIEVTSPSGVVTVHSITVND